MTSWLQLHTAVENTVQNDFGRRRQTGDGFNADLRTTDRPILIEFADQYLFLIKDCTRMPLWHNRQAEPTADKVADRFKAADIDDFAQAAAEASRLLTN